MHEEEKWIVSCREGKGEHTQTDSHAAKAGRQQDFVNREADQRQ